MLDKTINRRDFLKVLGISGAAATLAGCGNTSIESGVELVQSYVHPQDFVVPGNQVFYASTCTQCGSGCGIMGRVREGRVLKIEGNPNSVISKGKVCGLGQAAVQVQYNPDRLAQPLLRVGAGMKPITWDEAMMLISNQLDAAGQGEQITFLSDGMSGHQRALVTNFLSAMGSTHHVVYDALSSKVGRSARASVYGQELPVLKIENAKLILNFGSDFLNSGVSPVHMAGQYAQFRKAPRGTLIQIEPRMTMTGANADRWYPIIPGTEGVLALGIAQELVQHEEFAHILPESLGTILKSYDKKTVAEITGIPADVILHLSGMLWEKTPTLVMAGASVEGQSNGYSSVQAIELLNLLLNNRGKTLVGQAVNPFPQLDAQMGSYQDLVKLVQSMNSGAVKVLFVKDVNPVYSAPSFIPVKESLGKVPFKVAFVTQLDETASACDLVLPMLAGVEDFGTHVAEYQPTGFEMSIQQPLMEKLHPQSRGFGDVILDILRKRSPTDYQAFPDYYAYIKTALVKAKPVFKSEKSDDDYFEDALRDGVLRIDSSETGLEAHLDNIKISPVPIAVEGDRAYPFHMVPSVRGDWRDGKHTNLPWLQEQPDPLTTIVWDSWVELHPTTAKELNVQEGDILEIKSATGTLQAKAYLFPGIEKNTVSLPLGQGHTEFGRYATNTGVNTFQLINPVFDETTGELALYATRVSLSKTGSNERIVKDEGPTSLMQGRKLVATLSDDVAQLAKEINNVTK
jgi:molybdopterin-containing oxidoreductase family iron-sulfur binding subunit